MTPVESLHTPELRLEEAKQLGARLRTLRIARGMTQREAAARAGVSRSTAVLLEQGDESRTLSQVLRYLHALEPELTLAGLLTGKSAAVRAFDEARRVWRVRKPKARDARGVSQAGQSTGMATRPKAAQDPYDF